MNHKSSWPRRPSDLKSYHKKGICEHCGAQTCLARFTQCLPCAYKNKTTDEKERFWKKVKKTSSCWIWIGTFSHRYGQFHISRGGKWRPVRAHRFSWEITNGKIPIGKYILHCCDNPPCVNPKHLFLGTQLENMRDRFSKRR